ncbi:hypothetical protein CO046_03225 [Candidatus Peregrinibacteria bacterium CG_4_9_14_0_2_um_filter_53_11]|nr:MAG: hypothetical protein CO046_03225 [Candidatus Peregrinibacteria bacterium CG_4_9_14_0_2_um_filter_53_11]
MKIRYSQTSTTDKAALKSLRAKLDLQRGTIQGLPFARLKDNDPEEIIKLAAPYKHFSHICLVGLGGSSLGVKAIAHALGVSKITFLDNIDPQMVSQLLAGLDPKETLFIISSKSGGTIEVISLARILLEKIARPSQVVIITDPTPSPLMELAEKHKIRQIINSPADVPGRFSLLSETGLFPLACAGVPIEKLVEGARQTKWKQVTELAAQTYLNAKKGRTTLPLFVYSERLSKLTDWYIQLLAESIGKRRTVGITPLKAVGVKDQHAQLQLFLDGPRDKFFLFVKAENDGPQLTIPGEGYSLNALFDAEYRGVIGAFKKRKNSFGELVIEEVATTQLGELVYLLELQVACLGSLYGINFQNQPAVELSKQLTKLSLSKLVP